MFYSSDLGFQSADSGYGSSGAFSLQHGKSESGIAMRYVNLIRFIFEYHVPYYCFFSTIYVSSILTAVSGNSFSY